MRALSLTKSQATAIAIANLVVRHLGIGNLVSDCDVENPNRQRSLLGDTLFCTTDTGTEVRLELGMLWGNSRAHFDLIDAKMSVAYRVYGCIEWIRRPLGCRYTPQTGITFA